MVTIFALNNAQEASRYYENDNYYAKDSAEGIAATHWWGKGAEKLGLSDYVDPEKFTELLSGKINKEVTLERVRHDGGVSHKPGYDFTFSAPKSVSMLSEIGKDYRIYDAHNTAVNKTLEYLQSRIAQYRKTVDSHTQVELADNLIVAKFRHDTSRSVEGTIDCQLHTHCVVINAVESKDGKWRSLYERPLFDFKMTAGMIYRSALAMELKNLGYDIVKTRDDGLFEVAGFSREDIETFSKRRVKILEVMKEKGLFGVHAAQEVTLNTRESKYEIDRKKLDAHWRARIQEAGIEIHSVIEKSRKNLKKNKKSLSAAKNNSETTANAALQYALDHLGERQSVFQEKDLIRVSLQYALGEINIEDIHKAIEHFKSCEKLIYLGEHKHQDMFASQITLTREQKILSLMKAGQNEYDPIASKEAIDLYLKEVIEDEQKKGFTPTNGQLESIRFLAQSTDKFIGVQGYAGTGKTTMLRSICRLSEAANYSIRGAAPSASAADVLRGDTGIDTQTLSALLIDLAKEKIEQRHLKPEIIILDEASMASTHQMFDLMHHAERLNKRIFLVGDSLQLPAVEAGSPFSLMQNSGLSTTYLTEVVRQEAPDIKWGVNETIHGDVGLAISAIGNEAFIQKKSDGDAFKNTASDVMVIQNKTERLDAIAQSYLSLSQKDQDETIVLLGSNEDRQHVNEVIRDGLKSQGVVWNVEAEAITLQSKGLTSVEKQHVYNYQIGDRIRFNKNYRSLGIKRFDYLTVVGIDQSKQTLIFKKGIKTIRWSPAGSAKSKGSAVEVFEQEKRCLARGDVIRWTQNRKNKGIYNTETAEVLSVKGHIAKFKLRQGDIIELNLKEPINSHWDYAWSATVYAAQGKKARNVIAQLEGYNPNLTNRRSFYVTISRAVNTVHLYVDDLNKAIDTIQTHTGEKSNASDFLQAFKEKQAVERYIKKAPQKLDGHIILEDSLDGRLTSLAKKYVELSASQSTHLVSTDFKDRQRLNALIRLELKRSGVLTGEDVNVQSLRQYTIRSNDQNMQLSHGMVVGFNRGYKKYGTSKGMYYRIKSLNEIERTVVLGNSKNENIIIDVSFLVERQRKDIEICKQDTLLLCQEDSILWTKTYQNDGIIKGQSARIKDISKQGAMVELENGSEIALNLNDPRLMHFRYAYAKDSSDKLPKHYDIGLAHLDARIQSPKRIESVFGAMGKAKNHSIIYTHSKDYLIHQLKLLTKEDIELNSYSSNDIDQIFYKKLADFEQSKKITGKAWVSYFEHKQSGSNTENVLRNALILDRAHSELASDVLNDKAFDTEKVQALGHDVSKLKHYAKKHLSTLTVKNYQNASGLLKLKYAHTISREIRALDSLLKEASIDKENLIKEGWAYQRKLDKLKLTCTQRKLSLLVDRYFGYSQNARQYWSKIYQSKERGVQPNLARVSFANHLSQLRNQLAHEIVIHPKKYSHFTSKFSKKTNKIIQSHAQKHKNQLKKSAKRALITQTQNWKEVLFQDQKEYAQYQNVQYKRRQPSKVFWDKEAVLQNAFVKAEEIISSVIAEEKNIRQSKGHKIVWGKKNGSVHFHTSGSKEGLVNDYERNIHGDLITFYAKSKGLDWYDALSEVAAHIGMHPEHASIKTCMPIEEIQKKKQAAILKEEKRRERVKKLAQKTWENAQPIKGTLAETYLKKYRGATFDVGKLEVRFNARAPLYTTKNDQLKVFGFKPAMVVAFKDATDEVQAVQCTYLDSKTGNKDKTARIAKMSIGSQWGSAGEIYRGDCKKVFVAEGAETAMSLIEAEPNASIYITGGNMQNIQHYDFLTDQHKTNEIHIAADNDLSFDAGSWKSVESGCMALAQKEIIPLIYQPESIRGKKTDFNDVYKRYGANEVEDQLKPKYTIDLNQLELSKSALVSLVSIDENKNQINYFERQRESKYRIPDMKTHSISMDEKQNDSKEKELVHEYKIWSGK